MSLLKDTFKSVVVPINQEGYNIVLITAIFTVILSILSSAVGVVSFVFLLFTIYFFRNPKRVAPDSSTAIVAPADGMVDVVQEATPPAELELGNDRKWTRVSIFLSVFNVHAQRIPFSGTIAKLNYRPGEFFNVAVDKYSPDNERQSCLLETDSGLQIPFVQIAGLVARRIVCDLNVGQRVERGAVYGIIKFGSRVDIYLPEGIAPLVKVGQTMIGGESVIAHVL
jgi:phosphatidylserine decarboxylase